MPPIRVLLADDHETLREGLRALFETLPGEEVVGDVADGDDAVAAAASLHPDLVVLDLSMPVNGFDVMRRLKTQVPRVGIVVLTRHRDEAHVREALAAGASGYVLKQSNFQEVVRAVEATMRGDVYLDSRLASLVPEIGEATTAGGLLTSRETEVLRRAAAGDSNKSIASGLGISVKTVEVHKANAMRKLSLRDRSELVQYALQRGWLQEPV